MTPRPETRFRWGNTGAILLVLSVVAVLGVVSCRGRGPDASPSPAAPAQTPTATRVAATPSQTPTLVATTPTQKPTHTPTAPPDEPMRYVVQQGDTLTSIAETFGLTTQALALANAVRPGQLEPGQALTIPAPDDTTQAAAGIGADSGIGELVIEYPSHLEAGASHLVRVSILVPDDPAPALPDAGPATIELPAEAPAPESPGAARDQVYSTWIAVLPTMRITVSSADLQIAPVTIDMQAVDIYEHNSRTQWMWEIVAPEEAGETALAIEIGGEQGATLWEGNLQALVLAPAATPEPYVLFRSSFDEGFYDYEEIGALTVPDGWVPVWVERGADTPLDQLNRPEYDFKDIELGHTEVRTGRYAASIFTVFATHDGALYRRFSVAPGRLVRASVWAMGVSHDQAGRSGGLGMRVGIDPTGGTDPHAPTVEYGLYWSAHLADWHEAEWRQVEVEAVAQADRITVFLASVSDWPVNVNASHWDDLLIQVE